VSSDDNSVAQIHAGRGAELYSKVLAASAALDDLWAEWRAAPKPFPTGSEYSQTGAFWDRLNQASGARSAAGVECYRYFEGPEATAAERAAWKLMDPARWPGGRRGR
jgi:hypothetical protein